MSSKEVYDRKYKYESEVARKRGEVKYNKANVRHKIVFWEELSNGELVPIQSSSGTFRPQSAAKEHVETKKWRTYPHQRGRENVSRLPAEYEESGYGTTSTKYSTYRSERPLEPGTEDVRGRKVYRRKIATKSDTTDTKKSKETTVSSHDRASSSRDGSLSSDRLSYYHSGLRHGHYVYSHPSRSLSRDRVLYSRDLSADQSSSPIRYQIKYRPVYTTPRRRMVRRHPGFEYQSLPQYRRRHRDYYVYRGQRDLDMEPGRTRYIVTDPDRRDYTHYKPRHFTLENEPLYHHHHHRFRDVSYERASPYRHEHVTYYTSTPRKRIIRPPHLQPSSVSAERKEKPDLDSGYDSILRDKYARQYRYTDRPMEREISDIDGSYYYDHFDWTNEYPGSSRDGDTFSRERQDLSKERQDKSVPQKDLPPERATSQDKDVPRREKLDGSQKPVGKGSHIRDFEKQGKPVKVGDDYIWSGEYSGLSRDGDADTHHRREFFKEHDREQEDVQPDEEGSKPEKPGKDKDDEAKKPKDQDYEDRDEPTSPCIFRDEDSRYYSDYDFSLPRQRIVTSSPIIRRKIISPEMEDDAPGYIVKKECIYEPNFVEVEEIYDEPCDYDSEEFIEESCIHGGELIPVVGSRQIQKVKLVEVEPTYVIKRSTTPIYRSHLNVDLQPEEVVIVESEPEEIEPEVEEVEKPEPKTRSIKKSIRKIFKVQKPKEEEHSVEESEPVVVVEEKPPEAIFEPEPEPIVVVEEQIITEEPVTVEEKEPEKKDLMVAPVMVIKEPVIMDEPVVEDIKKEEKVAPEPIKHKAKLRYRGMLRPKRKVVDKEPEPDSSVKEGSIVIDEPEVAEPEPVVLEKEEPVVESSEPVVEEPYVFHSDQIKEDSVEDVVPVGESPPHDPNKDYEVSQPGEEPIVKETFPEEEVDSVAESPTLLKKFEVSPPEEPILIEKPLVLEKEEPLDSKEPVSEVIEEKKETPKRHKVKLRFKGIPLPKKKQEKEPVFEPKEPVKDIVPVSAEPEVSSEPVKEEPAVEISEPVEQEPPVEIPKPVEEEPLQQEPIVEITKPVEPEPIVETSEPDEEEPFVFHSSQIQEEEPVVTKDMEPDEEMVSPIVEEKTPEETLPKVSDIEVEAITKKEEPKKHKVKLLYKGFPVKEKDDKEVDDVLKPDKPQKKVKLRYKGMVVRKTPVESEPVEAVEEPEISEPVEQEPVTVEPEVMVVEPVEQEPIAVEPEEVVEEPVEQEPVLIEPEETYTEEKPVEVIKEPEVIVEEEPISEISEEEPAVEISEPVEEEPFVFHSHQLKTEEPVVQEEEIVVAPVSEEGEIEEVIPEEIMHSPKKHKAKLLYKGFTLPKRKEKEEKPVEDEKEIQPKKVELKYRGFMVRKQPVVVEKEPSLPVEEEPPISVEEEPSIPVKEEPPLPVEEEPVKEEPPMAVKEEPVKEEPPMAVEEEPVEEEPTIFVEEEPSLPVEEEPVKEEPLLLVEEEPVVESIPQIEVEEPVKLEPVAEPIVEEEEPIVESEPEPQEVVTPVEAKPEKINHKVKLKFRGPMLPKKKVEEVEGEDEVDKPEAVPRKVKLRYKGLSIPRRPILVAEVSEPEQESAEPEVEQEPVLEPIVETSEPVLEEYPVEEVAEPEPLVEEYVEPEISVEEVVEPEPFVEKEVVEPESLVEEVVEPESLVEEYVEPEISVEEAVEPEPLVEEAVEPEPLVEEAVEPEPLVDEAVEPEPLVEEAVEPEPLVEEVVPVAEPKKRYKSKLVYQGFPKPKEKEIQEVEDDQSPQPKRKVKLLYKGFPLGKKSKSLEEISETPEVIVEPKEEIPVVTSEPVEEAPSEEFTEPIREPIFEEPVKPKSIIEEEEPVEEMSPEEPVEEPMVEVEPLVTQEPVIESDESVKEEPFVFHSAQLREEEPVVTEPEEEAEEIPVESEPPIEEVKPKEPIKHKAKLVYKGFWPRKQPKPVEEISEVPVEVEPQEEPEVEVVEPVEEIPPVEITEPLEQEPVVEISEPEEEVPVVEISEPVEQEPFVEISEPVKQEPFVETFEPIKEESEPDVISETEERVMVEYKEPEEEPIVVVEEPTVNCEYCGSVLVDGQPVDKRFKKKRTIKRYIPVIPSTIRDQPKDFKETEKPVELIDDEAPAVIEPTEEDMIETPRGLVAEEKPEDEASDMISAEPPLDDVTLLASEERLMATPKKHKAKLRFKGYHLGKKPFQPEEGDHVVTEYYLPDHEEVTICEHCGAKVISEKPVVVEKPEKVKLRFSGVPVIRRKEKIEPEEEVDSPADLEEVEKPRRKVKLLYKGLPIRRRDTDEISEEKVVVLEEPAVDVEMESPLEPVEELPKEVFEEEPVVLVEPIEQEQPYFTEPDEIITEPVQEDAFIPEPEEPEIVFVEPEEPQILYTEPEEIVEFIEPELEPEEPEVVFIEPEMEPEIVTEPEEPHILYTEPEEPEVMYTEPEEPEVVYTEPEEPVVLIEPELEPELVTEPEEPQILYTEPEEPEVEFVEPELEPEVVTEPEEPIVFIEPELEPEEPQILYTEPEEPQIELIEPELEPEVIVTQPEPEPEVVYEEPEPEMLFTEPEPEVVLTEPEIKTEIVYTEPEEPEMVEPEYIETSEASTATVIEKEIGVVPILVSEDMQEADKPDVHVQFEEPQEEEMMPVESQKEPKDEIKHKAKLRYRGLRFWKKKKEPEEISDISESDKEPVEEEPQIISEEPFEAIPKEPVEEPILVTSEPVEQEAPEVETEEVEVGKKGARQIVYVPVLVDEEGTYVCKYCGTSFETVPITDDMTVYTHGHVHVKPESPKHKHKVKLVRRKDKYGDKPEEEVSGEPVEDDLEKHKVKLTYKGFFIRKKKPVSEVSEESEHEVPVPILIPEESVPEVTSEPVEQPIVETSEPIDELYVESVEPVIEEEEPVEEFEPVVEEEEPVKEFEPIVKEEKPVEEFEPVVEESEPVVESRKPYDELFEPTPVVREEPTYAEIDLPPEEYVIHEEPVVVEEKEAEPILTEEPALVEEPILLEEPVQEEIPEKKHKVKLRYRGWSKPKAKVVEEIPVSSEKEQPVLAEEKEPEREIPVVVPVPEVEEPVFAVAEEPEISSSTEESAHDIEEEIKASPKLEHVEHVEKEPSIESIESEPEVDEIPPEIIPEPTPTVEEPVPVVIPESPEPVVTEESIAEEETTRKHKVKLMYRGLFMRRKKVEEPESLTQEIVEPKEGSDLAIAITDRKDFYYYKIIRRSEVPLRIEPTSSKDVIIREIKKSEWERELQRKQRLLAKEEEMLSKSSQEENSGTKKRLTYNGFMFWRKREQLEFVDKKTVDQQVVEEEFVDSNVHRQAYVKKIEQLEDRGDARILETSYVVDKESVSGETRPKHHFDESEPVKEEIISYLMSDMQEHDPHKVEDVIVIDEGKEIITEPDVLPFKTVRPVTEVETIEFKREQVSEEEEVKGEKVVVIKEKGLREEELKKGDYKSRVAFKGFFFIQGGRYVKEEPQSESQVEYVERIPETRRHRRRRRVRAAFDKVFHSNKSNEQPTVEIEETVKVDEKEIVVEGEKKEVVELETCLVEIKSCDVLDTERYDVVETVEVETDQSHLVTTSEVIVMSQEKEASRVEYVEGHEEVVEAPSDVQILTDVVEMKKKEEIKEEVPTTSKSKKMKFLSRKKKSKLKKAVKEEQEETKPVDDGSPVL